MQSFKELRNIILGIPKLNNDEVNEVIQACKRRRARLARENAFKLRRGDIVRFAHYQGEIEKIKIKKAIVNVKGVRWNVPLNHLEKVA